MGNPVMVEMMAREKMRELQAEWNRPVLALNRDNFLEKRRMSLLHVILSSAWKRAVQLMPAWNR